jgi:hypothetical protein
MIVFCLFVETSAQAMINTQRLPAPLRARIESAVTSDPETCHSFFEDYACESLLAAMREQSSIQPPYTVHGHITTAFSA